MSLFVETPVEAERLLSVSLVGNDWFGSAVPQRLAQFRAVVGLVADQAFGRLASAYEPLCNGAIVRLTAGQEDGEEAAPSIRECVYLRVAPASRATNSLLLLPPFPPDAERWALTCVESIICVSADRPRPANSRNRFSQTPRRAQRTNRL